MYDEVATQGQGKPGAAELHQAVNAGWITIEPVTDLTLVERLTMPHISATDAAVVAYALEQQAPVLLADDTGVRDLATQEGLAITGTVGLLVRARLDDTIRELKPLLDQLIAAGFYLDPHGKVYQEALQRVGEIS